MSGKIKFIGMVLFLAAMIGGAAQEARAQSAADVAIMQNLRDNHGFGQAFGWSTTTVPCPEDAPNWAGVSCSDNRVAIITVGCVNNVLTTPFPGTEIAALTALFSLELRGCYLNQQAAGNFAPLDTLTQLTKLRIDANPGITGNFSDVFPQGLSPTRFPNLSNGSFFGASLGGQLPAGVMEFGSTRLIRLNHLRLSGTLPPTGNSSKNIWLNANQLEGVLPDYIRNATGVVFIRYNKFDVQNTPPGNIDTLDPLWRTTQTVPPTDVQVTANGAGTATLTWTPIAYQEHGGYYEVLSSQTAGGPYISRGTTAATGAKTASSLTVSGLPGGTNYFVVRTFTPAHVATFSQNCAGSDPGIYAICLGTTSQGQPAPNNPNDLTSVFSAETSAGISPPFVVNTISDNGTNGCDAAECTLREAVAAANATNAPDSITFAIPPTAANCPNGVCTITLTAGELGINNASTAGTLSIINSTGAMNLRVSGNNQSRVFMVNAGANLTLNGLTVRDGRTIGDINPTLQSAANISPAANGEGGGIHNSGTLSILNSTVSNNFAEFSGGGIFNNGGSSTTLINSTISRNSTQQSGGGMENSSNTVNAVNTTFSGNTALGTGGAMNNENTGNNPVVNLTNCTITANQANQGGAMLQFGTSNTFFRNTIIAGNTATSGFAPDLRGTFNSLGYNLLGVVDGLVTIDGETTGNITNQNARLAPLGFYGGATMTHALTSTSPAMGAGDNSEIQSITPPSSGSFTLTFNGRTTGLLSNTATAAQVQSALEGLTTIGAGRVSVTKPDANFIVVFQNTLANANLPQITGTGVVENVATQTIAEGRSAPTSDQRGAGRVGNLDIGAFELSNTANGGNFKAALPTGSQGEMYNFTLVADNGAFDYSVTGGALPNGIELTSGSVVLSGTPTENGIFNFSVTASDGTNSATTDYELEILPPLDSTPPVITPTVTGTLGDNNWYISDVQVSWSVADNESTITSFSGCDTQNVTTDTTGITFTCSATSAGGSDSQSVTIKRDATAPQIAFFARTTPNANGWNNSNVAVQWNCTDTMSGTVSSSVTTIVSAEGANQSAMGICTDNAGNPAQNTQSGINVDKTAPTITFDSRTSPNANGWNNTDVQVNWNCSDSVSGAVSSSVSQTVSSEGANLSSTGTCSDLAGNSASNTQSGIKIDKTAPSITFASRTPAANAAGWNNTDVSLRWNCADSLSGAGFANFVQTVSTEGANQSATGTCMDLAGNTNSDTQSGINIDKTAPSIILDSRTAANSSGWNNTNVSLQWSCSDNLSGAVNSTVSQTVSSEGSNQSSTGTCMDLAGNSASNTQSGINIDKTAPTITFDSRSPSPNANGWNNTNVLVEWNCNDAVSGAVNQTVSQTVSSEGANLSSTGSCFDVAGNPASNTQSGIKIDKTAPSVTFVSRTTPNANGWNNTNVTVNWSCGDALSGAVSPSVNQTLTNEGVNQSATGTCFDLAGNFASNTQTGINIDKTPPVINPIANITVELPPNSNTTSVAVNFPMPTASDNFGTVTVMTSPVSGSVFNVGTTIVNVTATDGNGNTAMSSFTVTVGYNFRGFFSPINNPPTVNLFNAGETILIRFSLSGFKGLNILAAGSPASRRVNCTNGNPIGGFEALDSSNDLQYIDVLGDRRDEYSYIWQTRNVWRGTCRQLKVMLNDGSERFANFRFR